MTTPDPGYGFQLCSADDPQRTDYYNTHGHHAVWAESWTHVGCAACIHWRKPIAAGPDGKAWVESEWEMVPGDANPIIGDRFCFDEGWAERQVLIGYNVTASEWCSNRDGYPRAFARRKPVNRVDPGEGWRLLEDGEVIRDGDEFHFCYATRGEWIKSASYGLIVGSPSTATGVYRRRIQSKPEPPSHEWVSVKDRLPEKPQRVAAINHGNGKAHCTEWNGTTFSLNPKPHYWMPLPPPPKSDAEIAWGKYLKETGYPHSTREPFIAGFEAGKAGKK
jgi:hypothetical protein